MCPIVLQKSPQLNSLYHRIIHTVSCVLSVCITHWHMMPCLHKSRASHHLAHSHSFSLVFRYTRSHPGLSGYQAQPNQIIAQSGFHPNRQFGVRSEQLSFPPSYTSGFTRKVSESDPPFFQAPRSRTKLQQILILFSLHFLSCQNRPVPKHSPMFLSTLCITPYVAVQQVECALYQQQSTLKPRSALSHIPSCPRWVMHQERLPWDARSMPNRARHVELPITCSSA